MQLESDALMWYLHLINCQHRTQLYHLHIEGGIYITNQPRLYSYPVVKLLHYAIFMDLFA